MKLIYRFQLQHKYKLMNNIIVASISGGIIAGTFTYGIKKIYSDEDIGFTAPILGLGGFLPGLIWAEQFLNTIPPICTRINCTSIFGLSAVGSYQLAKYIDKKFLV